MTKIVTYYTKKTDILMQVFFSNQTDAQFICSHWYKKYSKRNEINKIQILYTWDFHWDFSIIQPVSYDKIICPLLLLDILALEAFLYAWRSSWHWPLFLLSHFKKDRYKSLLQMINMIFLMTISFLFAKRIYAPTFP